jgi:hypothetical protein
MDNLPPLVDQNDDNKILIVILLSILGVICLFTLGATLVTFYMVNTVKQERKSYLVTQQAYASSIAVSATSTAVYQATQVAGYEFFDDFDDNENKWAYGHEDDEYWRGTLSVRDGAYIWDMREFYQDSSLSWRDYQDNYPITDFDLSVDAKLATPNAQNICYAVVFRSSFDALYDGAYVFSVCDCGQFSVEFDSDLGNDTVFTPWTQSSSIRSGDWNTLAVSARGDHFILSINNIIVNELTDSRRGSGYVYLLMRHFDTTPGTIMFDNFGLQPR